MYILNNKEIKNNPNCFKKCWARVFQIIKNIRRKANILFLDKRTQNYRPSIVVGHGNIFFSCAIF
jgi:hypothetical protein